MTDHTVPPASETADDEMFERMLRIIGPLRTHFGDLLNAEPTMTFHLDGTATVDCGGETFHLTAKELDEICG